MTPKQFAQDEYQDYMIYKELARVEPILEFKNILKDLASQELEHHRFWCEVSGAKHFSVSKIRITLIKLARRILGLTFIVKQLERNEHTAIRNYTKFIETADDEMREKVQQIIHDEEHHEHEFIENIKEEQVAFIGNIILGLNDGLIELTGALTGFAFAFANNRIIGLTGLIVGVAATLSMASSSFMQARHEDGKHPQKAAAYTGVSYFIVVILLVVPFFITPTPVIGLGIMFAIVLIIITATSYYTSILLDRPFRRQLGEMLIFSLGVALISFAIGSIFRSISGIEI